MKTRTSALLIGMVLGASSSVALAQYSADNVDADGRHIAFNPTGEISPGTGAPSEEAMVNIIRSGTPSALIATLEYGEMVECGACIPLLSRNLLESGDAEVRRISAWWLRRRVFGVGAVFVAMRLALANDTDEVRRSRAAEALGELLEASALNPLSAAASSDASAMVRRSAILALGRLNHQGSQPLIAMALEDDADASVRRAAVDTVLRINFADNSAVIVDALIAALADSDAMVRMRSARILGDFGVTAAATALAAVLALDDDRNVRQAAAFALGKLGGHDATLAAAQESEPDSLVLDAIRVALAM